MQDISCLIVSLHVHLPESTRKCSNLSLSFREKFQKVMWFPKATQGLEVTPACSFPSSNVLKLQPPPKTLHTGVFLERHLKFHPISEGAPWSTPKQHYKLKQAQEGSSPFPKPALPTITLDSSVTPTGKKCPRTPTWNVKILVQATHQRLPGEAEFSFFTC